MNKAEITYKHKHDTEDVLQVIKGWLLATTYITPTKIKKTKPHIGRWYIKIKTGTGKVEQEKWLLQFANQNVLDTATSQFV